MTDVTPVQSQAQFVAVASKRLEDAEESTLETVWNFWQESDKYLIHVPDWFMQKEIDRVRPWLLGRIEHDDASKGAILFDDLVALDIGTLRSHNADRFTFEETVQPIDVSDDSDYIDEPGMLWIPREQMILYDRV